MSQPSSQCTDTVAQLRVLLDDTVLLGDDAVNEEFLGTMADTIFSVYTMSCERSTADFHVMRVRSCGVVYFILSFLYMLLFIRGCRRSIGYF